jgi:LL-diaminopimelate aminotransferase
LADHPERSLIDFGIGENDGMADVSVRQAMAAEINEPANRGYADNGIAAYKEAVARFMAREFDVRLDPVKEVNHCIGTKTALAMLPAAFINPGDVTLMTVPGYPVAGTHTKYYGGEVYRLPLLAANDYYPDLDSIPADIRRRAKLLVVNYPNSPTGRVATVDFYKKVIDFAMKNEIVVVQDATHIMFTYEGRPLSFLQVPGAREVGVETYSMSKGWNMIGWRLGWVCGNELIVRAFADVKDNSDSGQFIAIQKAAVVALDNAEIPRYTRAKYERRLRLLVETLRRLGFQCSMPGGSYFLYAASPKGIAGGPSFDNAEACSQYLITEHSICTVPWDDAGANLRFSVTYEAADEVAEKALMATLEERLKGLKFEF